MKRKLVLPGGSGFLGTALARYFSGEGWEVVVLSRRPAPDSAAGRIVEWDIAAPGAWARELEGADAVINLAGRSIACLHTPENRRQILASRIDAVLAIDAAAAACARPPPVLVQASAVGIYGDAGDRICDEKAPAGTDFVAEVVSAWESAFFREAGQGGPRRVALRIGFVLGAGGGLDPLARLARRFLGGAVGGGRHYVSWLHLGDFCRICAWAVGRDESRGVYNAVAPVAATNAELMRELRSALNRPWSPPAPAWAVAWIARHVMRVEPSLALSGCRCLPGRLLAEGFEFRHPNLREALRDLLARV